MIGWKKDVITAEWLALIFARPTFAEEDRYEYNYRRTNSFELSIASRKISSSLSSFHEQCQFNLPEISPRDNRRYV